MSHFTNTNTPNHRRHVVSALWPVAMASLLALSGCVSTSWDGNAAATQKAVAKSAQDTCLAPGVTTTDAIVRVATDDGSDGSGVVVDHGRVLTAAHVIEDGKVTLVWVGDGYRRAYLLATDPNSDLALLSVNTWPLEPLRLARGGPAINERVWAVGYPLALDLTTTLGEFQEWNNGSLFTSAPIKAGNSGGGLLRCSHGKFELAGMVRGYGAYWRGDELVSLEDSLSISVPAATIETFIQQLSL